VAVENAGLAAVQRNPALLPVQRIAVNVNAIHYEMMRDLRRGILCL
jgi:hypothetical protein